jgi:hypothetical protein
MDRVTPNHDADVLGDVAAPPHRRRTALWCILGSVAVLAIVAGSIPLLEWNKYRPKSITLSGVLKTSMAALESTSTQQRRVYLLADDGKRYSLQRARNEQTYNTIMSAKVGDRLTVSGQYWRPRKSPTRMGVGGRMYDGPEMSDPLDWIDQIDFILVVEAAQTEQP